MTRRYKFEEGDVVYEITRPQELMRIVRRKGFLCYCCLVGDEKKESAFMERDLKKEETVALPDGLPSN